MTTMQAVAEYWAKVKLPARPTGLPMAVGITENDGYPHDVRVKVSILHGGRGSWRAAPATAEQPQPLKRPLKRPDRAYPLVKNQE